MDEYSIQEKPKSFLIENLEKTKNGDAKHVVVFDCRQVTEDGVLSHLDSKKEADFLQEALPFEGAHEEFSVA